MKQFPIKTWSSSLILKGLAIEYNFFQSHIRARPIRIALIELRDLLLEEENDLDTASMFTAMMTQKSACPNVKDSTSGSQLSGFSHGRGHLNRNWGSNWNVNVDVVI